DPAIKRSGLAVSRKQGQAWCSRLGGPAADVEVELNGQAGVADGVPDVAKGFGFDALVEGAQVGGLAGGDGDDDFGGGGVSDDPGPGGVHAVVGADFPDEGAGERARPQNGGPLVGGDGDGNVAGPVGGDEQGYNPAQRDQGDHQAEPGGGVPHPAVMANVTADAVGEQDPPRERGPEYPRRGGHAGGSGGQDEQAEHGEGDAVGAVGVHQRLRE